MSVSMIVLVAMIAVLMSSMLAMLVCYSKLPSNVNEMTKLSVWKEYGVFGKLFVVFSGLMVVSSIMLMIDIGFFIR